VYGSWLPPAWDPGASAVVRAYLARLGAGLAGGRRARASILAEVADGLVEAVEAHVRRGLAPEAAARRAVDEFGDPATLAAQFAAEQAGTTAHRVGLGLVTTGPVVGTVWLAALADRNGLGWWEQLHGLAATLPAYPMILAVAVPSAVLAAVTGAGPLARRLAVTPRRAAAAAMLAAGATVVGDSTLLAGLLLAAAGGAGLSLLAAAAGAVSLTRLTLAGGAARRCAALRAAAA
jgi:hypothetical protein